MRKHRQVMEISRRWSPPAKKIPRNEELIPNFNITIEDWREKIGNITSNGDAMGEMWTELVAQLGMVPKRQWMEVFKNFTISKDLETTERIEMLAQFKQLLYKSGIDEHEGDDDDDYDQTETWNRPSDKRKKRFSWIETTQSNLFDPRNDSEYTLLANNIPLNKSKGKNEENILKVYLD